MLLQRALRGVAVFAPCKINLHLEILRRREDGYHDIESVMMALSLGDRMEIEPTDDGSLHMSVHVPDHSDVNDEAWVVPSDHRNLVLKALSTLREKISIQQGARVRLWKQIPASAGLGGGSSDAAAALVAGSLLWTNRFDRGLVESIASKLGSDLSFFLGSAHSEDSGLAICRGRGEQIEPLDVDPLLHFVLVHPPLGCSTAAVYRDCEVPEHPVSAQSMVDALRSRDLVQIGRSLHNRLQAPASRVNSWIARIQGWFDECPVIAHRMTGSGSAYFALCENELIAHQVAEQMKAKGLPRVYVSRSFATPSIENQIESQTTLS